MFRNNWNNFDLQRIISNDKLLNINAIKSCIEADEANLLLEIIQNNLKARIYCLICCFTYIPSIKCIERLIAEGTPLNISFEENPFQSTPLEYLHTYFKNSSNYQPLGFRTSSGQMVWEGIWCKVLRCGKYNILLTV